MFRDAFQILFQIDSLHESVKCQNRVTNIQIIRKKYWHSALNWFKIFLGIDYHCKLIIPLKEDFCISA